MSPRIAALALAALLPAAAAAQTGPFADGELLVRFTPPGLPTTLSRVDPASGAFSTLSADIGIYGGAGWIAYDGSRGGLVAYTSLVSLGYFSPRLVLLRDDGDATDLGFLGIGATALAPAGDGRVYLRKGVELHLLDADHELSPVLSGGLPLALDTEHMIYDAPSSSLIAVAGSQATTPCSAFGLVTALKLPLAAGGKSIAGPILCASYPMPGVPVGIDRMPGGDYLITLADGGPADHQLLRLDPTAMALTLFAQPVFSDLDGGAYCEALGRAVILEDGGNTLRSYQAGEVGSGTVIPTGALGPDPISGWSTTNNLAVVRVLGPACTGDAQGFGTGLAGSSQIVPGLGAAGCPRIGQGLPLVVTATPSPVLIGLSLGSAAYPLFGGTGYLLPPLVAALPLTLTGTPGLVVHGTVVVPVPPTPPLIGVHVFAQAGAIDAGAPQGVALSRGLELVIGG